MNDKFGVGGEFVTIEKYHMIIYNRLGEVLFETSDPYIMWDGTFKGVKVPSGVYTYTVEITETLMDSYVLNGTVHLLR